MMDGEHGCHVWLVVVTFNKTGTILGLECQVMHFGGNQICDENDEMFGKRNQR